MVSKVVSAPMKSGGRQGQAFKDKSKPADIRQSNINAAKGKNFFPCFNLWILLCRMA